MNHDISFNKIRTEELTHHLSIIMKKRASVVHLFTWENNPINVERRILELADVVMDQLSWQVHVYISYLLMKEKTLWNTKYREEALLAVDNPIEATTNHCALGCNSRPRGP